MYKSQKPSYSAKESAIYLLSKRDHGTVELTQKLTIKGYEAQEIEMAVQYCIGNHYLDDLRYAKSQVRLWVTKGYGRLRIEQKLVQKRVVSSVVSQAIEEEQVDWFELAKQIAEKKFKGKKAQEQKEYAKQIRFLQYRGFDFEQINYALSVLS